MSDRLVTEVVVAALSVYGKGETPYFDSSISGTDHQHVASSAAGVHQASRRHRDGTTLAAPPGAGLDTVSRKMAAGTSTATVAAALMPLHNATATADRAAARAGPVVPAAAPASGSRTQGSIAIGRNSPDSSPSMLSAIGDKA